jgi:hypothetical protein
LLASERDLAGDTAQEAMAKMGEIYRANVGYNPYHGEGTQGLGPHPSLARQFEGMKNLDPGLKQQRAYSEVTGERRTKLLCLWNIRFFNKDKKLIPHNSPLIFQAENMSITFEWQKKDVRDDTITHQQSGNRDVPSSSSCFNHLMHP